MLLGLWLVLMLPHATLAQAGGSINFGIIAVDSAGQVLELDPHHTWLRGIHEQTWNSEALRLARGNLVTTDATTRVTATGGIAFDDGLGWRAVPFKAKDLGVERVEMDKAGTFYVQYTDKSARKLAVFDRVGRRLTFEWPVTGFQFDKFLGNPFGPGAVGLAPNGTLWLLVASENHLDMQPIRIQDYGRGPDATRPLGGLLDIHRGYSQGHGQTLYVLFRNVPVQQRRSELGRREVRELSSARGEWWLHRALMHPDSQASGAGFTNLDIVRIYSTAEPEAREAVENDVDVREEFDFDAYNWRTKPALCAEHLRPANDNEPGS
jgi:hypothetical protein